MADLGAPRQRLGAAGPTVRMMGWTRTSPGLPLRNTLRRAPREVAADPTLAEVRQALLVERFAAPPGNACEAVRRIEADAAAAGCPVPG